MSEPGREVLDRVEALLATPLDGRLHLATSGSTGAPRTVTRSVVSWAASLEPFSAVTGIGAGDVVWAPGGPGSTLTLYALYHARSVGRPVVATGPWRGVPRAAGPADAATVVQCVPAVLDDVVTAREAGRLPRLWLAVVAGARLPDALAERARATGLDVLTYYGAAELSFVAVGRDRLVAFPGVEVAAPGGLLRCRSPYLADGVADDVGWAGVGDRGRVEPDGSVVVLGRGGSLSVGGTLVALDDVEAVLAGTPGAAEVVCLGEPHGRLGERVLAVVRPAAGTSGRDAVAAVRERARAALPAVARPVRHVVVHDLPRTDGGKVARAVLAGRLGLPSPLPATT